MTLNVDLHEPDRAVPQSFESSGKIWGCVTIYSGTDSLQIFTTPEKAHALATILNMSDDYGR